MSSHFASRPRIERLVFLSAKAAFVLGAWSCSSSGAAGASGETAPDASPLRGHDAEAAGDGGTRMDPSGKVSAARAVGGTAEGREGGGEGGEGAAEVQLIGRFDRRSPGPRCAWPGCRIVARFEGTALSVRLDEIDESWMLGAPSEWDVTIDGALQPKLVTSPGEKTYPLASSLTQGEHVVELYKRSEAQDGTTRLLGFDLHGGALLPPPPRSQRRIEIIGDSAAAGFGVEGKGPKCPGYNWSAQWQNFHVSFGALLGERLDAEVFGTVYSGKGMAKNIWLADKETMPDIFPRTNPIDPESTWDFSSWIPQVVVIMIGGNDFAVSQPTDEGPATLAQFEDAYDRFLQTVRQRYPDAHVFLVTSPSVSDAEPAGRASRTNVKAGIATALERAKSQRGPDADVRVYAVEPPPSAKSELTGCDGHGGPEFHERIAEFLMPLVKEKAGW